MKRKAENGDWIAHSESVRERALSCPPFPRSCNNGRKKYIITIIALLAMYVTSCGGNKSDSEPSPIHEAVYEEDLEKIALYLDQGVDINSKNKDRDTCLHIAVLWDNKYVAEFLLSKGADIEARDEDDYTPLLSAAAMGRNRELVDLFIENGGDVKTRGNDGTSLLLYAAENNWMDIVDDLVTNHSEDVNSFAVYGYSPLGYAARAGHLEMMKYLLERGAKVNGALGLPNIDNKSTPIHTAVFFGQMEAVDLLLDKGARIDTEILGERSVIHHVAYSPFDKVEMLEFLIAKGINIKTLKKDSLGQTPLHVAAMMGNMNILGLLKEEGLNVKERTKDGSTALHLATMMAREEVMVLLIKEGLDTNAKNINGSTPLHELVKMNAERIDLAKFLVEKGADPGIKDKEGKTPSDVVKEMIEKYESLDLDKVEEELDKIDSIENEQDQKRYDKLMDDFWLASEEPETIEICREMQKFLLEKESKE